MGKTVLHMTVTSVEVLAARLSGFMTGRTTLSQSWHLYSTQVCSRQIALLCVVSESSPFLSQYFLYFCISNLQFP